MKEKNKRDIIEIYPNGDPFGRGYQGSQSTDGGQSWFFCGDISPMSREAWRRYCRREGIILRHRD